MPTVTIKVDASDLKRSAEGYRIGGKLVDVAVVRAMNRGGDAGLVETRRALVAATGITDRDTRRSKGLDKRLARANDQTYRVMARSSYTPLSYFRPEQTPQGVRAAPWNRQAVFKGTFLMRLSSGYVGVFKRDATSARSMVTTRDGRRINAKPMKELWGPSLAVEMMKGGIPEIFSRRASEATMNRLPHEIQFELGKALAKKGRR